MSVLSRPHLPPTPRDPLAIDPRDVASASLDGVVLSPGSPAFNTAAALPGRLIGLQSAKVVSWVEPRMLQLHLRDGTALWLQLMRSEQTATIRITADGASTRVRHLRALRLQAFHLPADSLSAIFGEVTGEHGISQDLADINSFIHKNKARQDP